MIKKIKKTKKYQKQTHIHQQKQTNKTIMSVFVLSNMCPALEGGWCFQWYSIREQRISLSWQISTKTALTLGWDLGPIPIVNSQIFSGLNLCGSYACCQSLCEFLCVSVDRGFCPDWFCSHLVPPKIHRGLHWL